MRSPVQPANWYIGTDRPDPVRPHSRRLTLGLQRPTDPTDIEATSLCAGRLDVVDIRVSKHRDNRLRTDV
jgi:hypothetical protein